MKLPFSWLRQLLGRPANSDVIQIFTPTLVSERSAGTRLALATAAASEAGSAPPRRAVFLVTTLTAPCAATGVTAATGPPCDSSRDSLPTGYEPTWTPWKPPKARRRPATSHRSSAV